MMTASAAPTRITAKTQKVKVANVIALRPWRAAYPRVPERLSSVFGVFLTVCGDLRLVAVAHREQHFLRVVEVAAPLAVIFEDSRLDDRIHRTAFLAEAAEDAFRQVDVVARRAARAVLALLRFDRDRDRRTHRLAELASDATLLAVRIPPQRMQSAKPRAHRRLFLGKLDGDLAREQVAAGQREPLQQLEQ